MPLVIHFFLALFYSQSCDECRLLETAWEFQNKAEFDSAIVYYHKTIKASIEQENLTYLGYAHINLGNVYGKLLQWDSAIFYNQAAFTVFDLTNNNDQKYFCLLNIAQYYNAKGLYHSALQELQKNEALVKMLNSPSKDFEVEITKGRSWLELEEYELSLQAYEKALTIAKKNQLLEEQKSVFLDIGNLFMRKGLLDRAQNYYNEALTVAYESQDSIKIAMAQNNLGIVALRKQEYDSARQLLFQALELKRRFLVEKLANTYTEIGTLLIKQNRLELARSYLDSALFSQDFEVQINANEALVKYYQLTNNYQKAFTTMRLLDSLKNVQFNNERLEASKLQAAIDLNQVNSQLDQQVVINQNQKRMNLILMVAGLIILIVAAVLLVLFRSNFKLRKYNELLLKEQNHRVKNNLQMISSLLTLQAHGTHSNDAQQVLNESQSRINSVSLLHRMLYEGDNLEQVKLKEYCKSLVEEIIYASPRKLTTDLDIDEDLSLSVEKATSLGLIVNELITNSIKHVSSETHLTVLLSIHKQDRSLNFTYKDNSVSFNPETWENANSFGNQLIILQSEQLRGAFEVTYQNGFQYKLLFKP